MERTHRTWKGLIAYWKMNIIPIQKQIEKKSIQNLPRLFNSVSFASASKKKAGKTWNHHKNTLKTIKTSLTKYVHCRWPLEPFLPFFPLPFELEAPGGNQGLFGSRGAQSFYKMENSIDWNTPNPEVPEDCPFHKPKYGVNHSNCCSMGGV